MKIKENFRLKKYCIYPKRLDVNDNYLMSKIQTMDVFYSLLFTSDCAFCIRVVTGSAYNTFIIRMYRILFSRNLHNRTGNQLQALFIFLLVISIHSAANMHTLSGRAVVYFICYPNYRTRCSIWRIFCDNFP